MADVAAPARGGKGGGGEGHKDGLQSREAWGGAGKGGWKRGPKRVREQPRKTERLPQRCDGKSPPAPTVAPARTVQHAESFHFRNMNFRTPRDAMSVSLRTRYCGHVVGSLVCGLLVAGSGIACVGRSAHCTSTSRDRIQCPPKRKCANSVPRNTGLAKHMRSRNVVAQN